MIHKIHDNIIFINERLGIARSARSRVTRVYAVIASHFIKEMICIDVDDHGPPNLFSGLYFNGYVYIVQDYELRVIFSTGFH